MKDLSFYDLTGLVVPGSLMLLGVIYFLPELRPVFGKDALSVGGFGLFVMVAYAAGHLIAAVGNAFEAIAWLPAGGMPTSWVCSNRLRLLNAQQLEAVRTKLRVRLGIDLPTIQGCNGREWRQHFSLLYRDVVSSGVAGRIETFNGNYALSRGLAIATLAVAGVALALHPDQWRLPTLLAAVSAVYLYRMYRFGLNFAREVYSRFIFLPDNRN